MNFNEAIEIIADCLKTVGTNINADKYDGLIVKKLEASNTLDTGRTTKQSHIAITGPQMDLFPYVRADGYFEVEYDKEDPELKKYFVAQIPAYLHKDNVNYINGDNAMADDELVHISIVRSRRNNAADQIQMSMTYMDSPKFIEFRRSVHAGSYLIILKRTKELLYDVFAVKPGDSSSLNDINNCFYKLPTNTTVKLDEIIKKEPEDIPQEQSDETKSCLDISRVPRSKKVFPLNFIVYGAPGTGKTYSMVEYALAIIDNVSVDEFRDKNKDRKANVLRYKALVKAGQIVFTTFHQNYGYEEFIQGLRPDKDSENMAFKTVDGVFKTIADKALKEEQNFVIIIDEINRANISKVFGELITLIEEDKRWGELNETSATLQSGDPFAVPNNLYIVGTMNSADKSISLIDAALRRRFDFIEQKPDSSLVPSGVLRTMFETINERLVQELDSTDLLIGHSYFMNKTESDLCGILNNNIIPLLYEYFYDNRKKVASLLKDAIDKAGAKVEIFDEKVGRLSVKNMD